MVTREPRFGRETLLVKWANADNFNPRVKPWYMNAFLSEPIDLVIALDKYLELSDDLDEGAKPGEQLISIHS